MPRIRKKKKQTPFRFLAWVLALLLALASLFLAQTRLGFVLQFAAAFLFAVGAVWPRVFRRPYVLFISPVRRWARQFGIL